MPDEMTAVVSSDGFWACFSTQPNCIWPELWFHNTENPEDDRLGLQFPVFFFAPLIYWLSFISD